MSTGVMRNPEGLAIIPEHFSPETGCSDQDSRK